MSTATDLTDSSSQPVLDMVANLRNLQPTAEIRQHYQYNNEHYFTLAAIVERLTKQPLHDFVQENIFNKLSMSASTYNATLARATGRLTDGFSHTGQNITLCKEKSKGAKHQQKSCHGKVESIGWWAEGDGLENAGAGGVITSATDIVGMRTLTLLTHRQSGYVSCSTRKSSPPT